MRITHRIIVSIIIPMYNAHPYFSFKNLGKKMCVIDADTGPHCPCVMDEMRQIHTNYRNPVEEKG